MLLLTVIFEGNPTIVGLSLSITVTVKLEAYELPLASVAVYVTIVVPTENTPPFDVPAVCAIECPEQLSAEVGAIHETLAPQTPLLLFTVIFSGNPRIVGFSVSFTVTVKEAETWFPLASVAVYVTTVVPIGNKPPFVTPLVCIKVTSQLSDTLGASHETMAPQTPGSFTRLKSDGIPEITGF